MVVLVSVELALVGPDEQRQVVLAQHSFGHVRPEVAAAAAECVRPTAVLRRRVTPQDVQHLHTQRKSADTTGTVPVSRFPGLAIWRHNGVR